MVRSNRFFSLASAMILCLFFCSHKTDATETDVACLTSFKNSIEDPLGYFHTWDFSNQVEGFICSFVGVECWHPNENKVLNLKLTNMGLKGKFPRSLANCTSLTGLDLSNNRFSGHIPPDISKILPFATSLDLSSNAFRGAIPAELANCSYMNVLKLDHNRLSGRIPPEFVMFPRIQHFNVANNFLTGPIPNISGTSAEDFANNPGLCGGPLPPCRKAF